MNLGLGNLVTLKAQLLAEALRAGTRYDAQLQSIGRGVAALMDRATNRRLGRVAGDTVIFRADLPLYFLPRYPLEAISLVELKDDTTAGWVTQTDAVYNSNAATGEVNFGVSLGPRSSQVRVTFTGGYWFDETEEENDTLPSGATALPADLQLAWILQCRAVWQAIDKTGVDVVKTGSSSAFVTGSLGGLDLIPQVAAMLLPYRRFQIL
jgi:hypothetical protein